MKKLIRNLGLHFLRLSGMEISKETMKHILNPIPFEATFFYPRGAGKGVAAKMYSEAEYRLLEQAKPFIHVEHTENEDGMKVRMKVVIQAYQR
jgi:hypothetical protein